MRQETVKQKVPHRSEARKGKAWVGSGGSERWICSRVREEPFQIGAGGWRATGATHLRMESQCDRNDEFERQLTPPKRWQEGGNIRRLQVARKRALPYIGITPLTKPQHIELSLKSWEIKALKWHYNSTMCRDGIMICPMVYLICNRTATCSLQQMHYGKLWKSDIFFQIKYFKWSYLKIFKGESLEANRHLNL